MTSKKISLGNVPVPINIPTTINPTTINPTTINPTTINPTTINPTTINPMETKQVSGITQNDKQGLKSDLSETKIINPISDDTLDYLDSQMDRFNETNNLGEKISIYDHLKESVNNLEKEVSDMLKIIDTIDIDSFNNDDTKPDTDKSDINDDIVNIEKMMQGLQEEEIMQIKIMHFKRIAEVVKNCKAKCHSDNMKITKCN